MSRTTRKIFAVILLIILLVVPFIDLKLGAFFWMCAWLIFIFQNLYQRREWKLEDEEDDEKNGDDDENDPVV